MKLSVQHDRPEMKKKVINPENCTPLQEFSRKESKESEHDTMMIWLDSEIISLAKQIIQYNEKWDKESINKVKELAQGNVQQRISNVKGEIIGCANCSKESTNYEYYQRKKKSLDEQLKELSSWKPPAIPKKELEISENKWQVPVRIDCTVGFIDLLFKCRTKRLIVEGSNINLDQLPYFKAIHKNSYLLAFVIKPIIPVMCDVIREIRNYGGEESYTFYIVSPDDRFVNHTTKQGIGFVKYPTGEIFRPKKDDKR